MEFSKAESEDDEVFAQPQALVKRTRHLSDCIDSIGNNMTVAVSKQRHSFSGCSDPKQTTIDINISPPDLGYYSPSANSYLSCKPIWFKYSASSIQTYGDDVDANNYAAGPSYNNPPTLVANNANEGTTTVYKQQFPVASVTAKMPVEKYSESYNMNHPKRGRAIILNHYKFIYDTLPDRLGSEHDVASLEKCFDFLGFDVETHHNLDLQKIKQLLHSVAMDDHANNDCFVLSALTHGMQSNFLWAYDQPYNADLLWNTLAAYNCPTLAGKPKLFFIQACRGDGLDSGVNMVAHTQVDSGCSGYKIPSYADFLLAFSTTIGMYSFRNAEKGTWFIQCLCEEMMKYAPSEDILRIMTRVLRRVALDYESLNHEQPWLHGQKQVPTIHSMLIRDVYLQPKQKPHSETILP